MVLTDMNKHASKVRRGFLISIIVIVVMAALVASYLVWWQPLPANAAAVVIFEGEKLIVNKTTVDQVLASAASQNVNISRQNVINQLAQGLVLDAKIRHLGIVPTQAQVDAALSQQIAALDAQGLNQTLQANNVTRENFTQNLRATITQNLILQQLFAQQIAPNVLVPTTQLQQIYSANPSQFTLPATVGVKHILICYTGAPGCQLNITKEQAKSSIDVIYQLISNRTATLEQLASQYSTDQVSAASGGDLGSVAQGQTVKEFEQVAFSTQVGEISKPFETPFGFHVLMVYSKQTGQQLSFAQVAPTLNQQVLNSQASTLEQAYLAGLMGGAKIVYN